MKFLPSPVISTGTNFSKLFGDGGYIFIILPVVTTSCTHGHFFISPFLKSGTLHANKTDKFERITFFKKSRFEEIP